MEISDRVAIVTGAGSGVGRVIAERLARAGAVVLVVDLDHQRAESVSSRLDARGGRGVAVCADILKADELEAVVRRAEGLGGPPFS